MENNGAGSLVAQPERVAGALLHRLELERGLVGRQLMPSKVDALATVDASTTRRLISSTRPA